MVEQPSRHTQEAVLRRTVQHRHAAGWAQAGKIRARGSRACANLLFGVTPTDPLTFAAVPLELMEVTRDTRPSKIAERAIEYYG